MTFRKFLFAYILNTFTATCRPWYSHFHTSPKPPQYGGSPVRLSPSWICSDLGSKLWAAQTPYNDFKQLFRTCGGKSGLSDTYEVEERVKRRFSRTGGRRHTSSTASIKAWASLFGRRETVSIAFVLEKTASIDEMSSSWGMPPLTSICKACSPRSGGPTDAKRLHRSDCL